MDTVINIRTNKEIRTEAQRVFSSIGISTSAGINLFLNQVVQEKGLPFIPTTNLKKIRERWDAQITTARLGNRYKDAKSILRGL